jgi:hypothetical protein
MSIYLLYTGPFTFSFDASGFDVILRNLVLMGYEDFDLDTYRFIVILLNKCGAC